MIGPAAFARIVPPRIALPRTRANAILAVMPAPLRIVVAVAVLTVGIACAAFFRRDHRDSPCSTGTHKGEPTSGTVELGPTNSTQAMEQPASNGARPAGLTSHFILRPGVSEGTRDDTHLMRPPATVQPQAAHRDDSHTAQPASRRTVPSIPSMPATFPKTSDARPNRVGDLPPTSEPRSDRRIHRVVDGDTLETIAERYFGSADHAEDILQANSQTLPNPKVLPIGVELVIPNPLAGASSRIAPASSSAPSDPRTLAKGNLGPNVGRRGGTQEAAIDHPDRAAPKQAPEANGPSAAIAWPSSELRPAKGTSTAADGWESAEK